MVTTSPYLPYIIKDVVAKVNTTFSTRAEDPFNVFFDHGLEVAVTRSIYKKENAGIEDADIFPLVWLVTPSIEISSGVPYKTATFDVIIAMPTSNAYTQAQRDEITFLPRLIPIYDEFFYQLSISDAFSVKKQDDIKERYRYRPYWGGGDGGVDNKNLFKNFIDALQVMSITVNLKKVKQECL